MKKLRKMSYPFVSIIVPVYNSEAMIAECIESLLNQDYPKDKYELIVVDNNSTDNTAAVIKRFPVVYIKEERQSSYAARNAGSKHAKGEALFFFDADQIVKKDFLKHFVKQWDDKDYSAFGAQYESIGDQDTIAGKYWHEQAAIRFTNTKNNGSFARLGGGNALIRRKAFDDVKGYNLNLISWGDYDFAFRLSKAGHRIKYIDDAVIGHKERNTVKSMLKREYRIGFGRSHFDSIHEDHQESIWNVFFKAIKRTVVGLLALVWGLVKPLQNKSRREHLGIICLDIAMRWAYLLGRIHFVLNINQGRIPAKW